jgi:hypothetical protein
MAPYFSVVYLMTLSLSRQMNDTFEIKMKWPNLNTIIDFVRTDCGKQRRTSISIVGVSSKIEPGTSRI